MAGMLTLIVRFQVYCRTTLCETNQMAEIQSLTFTITRTSSPIGHICRIDYSYYLSIDQQEFRRGCSYNVVVELRGDDIAHDKPLGEAFYDAHVTNKDSKMPTERNFIVDCEVLNEALGMDQIYLKLIIKSSEGETLTAKSGTIKDRF